jgi:hypothetical protein
MASNTQFSNWAYGDDLENTSEQLASTTASAGASTGVSVSAPAYPSYDYSGCEGDTVWLPNDTGINWDTGGYNGVVSSLLEPSVTNPCISSLRCPSPQWSVPMATVRPIARRMTATNEVPVAAARLTTPPKPIARRMSAPVVNPMTGINVNQIVGDMIRPVKEYKLSKNKYMKGSYSGEIKTHIFYGRVSENASMPFRYDHLSVLDILKHVTCGGVLCDSYHDSFLDYIVSALKSKYGDVNMYKEKVSMIDGGVYEREMPMVAWSEYCYVGKLCLEWVLCNPEKLGRG